MSMSSRQFAHWLYRYRVAWEQGDPDAVVALFSEDAAYHETPFDPPMVGAAAIRRYWEDGARDGQADVRFEAEITGIDGSIGYAWWRARFTRTPGSSMVQLDGILRATFDDTGRCTTFREWWHRRETPAESAGDDRDF